MEQNKNDHTLLVGLGGTGASVAEQIKKKLAAIKPEDRLCFLAIDTDEQPKQSENASDAKS